MGACTPPFRDDRFARTDGYVDRVMIRFDESRQLPKLQLFGNSSKLYIPMDGEDYAVVRSEKVGEMPVSFSLSFAQGCD